MRYLAMNEMIKNLSWKVAPGVLCAAVCVSCSKIGEFAEERADRAAYGNIYGAQQTGLGEATEFSIDQTEGRRTRQELEATSGQEESTLLSLAETLAIAVSNSRSYQLSKENLFLEALSLTETQKAFNWDTSASQFNVGTSYSDNGSTTETFGDSGVDGSLDLSVRRTLLSGARVTLGFTENIVDYFTDPDTSSESGVMSFNVVQPLLNGFGPLVSKEPLRQAERNMIYAVRDFRRYQQDFLIDITSLYYSTLRSRDQLINAEKNYESTVINREQTEAYKNAGRIADFEAAQARQSELNAEDRLASARASYERALDDFRYALGLPIDLRVEPDPSELDMLVERGLQGLDITLDEAVESAISNRLDLITMRQEVEDRERALEIQQRDFLPNLDVEYNLSKDVQDGGDASQDLNVGLSLPFDWTEKRNAYRRAQINLNRELRSLEQGEWDVKRNVRNLWRTLEQNRSVYNNRLLSVELAVRRVENSTLLLKQGKALTRDVLEAQDDLLNAQNDATVALVDYTINRLRFWNAIERFEIDPKGMWYEGINEDDVGTVETARD